MSKIKLRTLGEYLHSKRIEIEHELDSWTSQLEAPESLIQSIRYSLLGGGKRIRPILLLATVNSLSGDEQAALPFACAIELIHTYSLIHDDLPCMDNDDYRRGKLTCHKVFGEAHAVLTGDALLTEAFGWMARASYVDSSVVLTIIGEGARFTGAQGMVGGQVTDMQSEKKVLSKKQLDDLHCRKTADLLIYAIRTGAYLSKASNEIVNILTEFATCLGLAFQIQDDILSIIGDSRIMGKKAGRDEEKNTYPTLIGVKESQNEVYELTQRAKKLLQNLEQKGIEGSLLLQISDYLLSRDR